MSHQQPSLPAPALRIHKEPTLPVLTRKQRNALSRLEKAFAEAEPLAILAGAGKSDMSFLIDRFLGRIDCDVAVVRIAEPCSDEITLMSEIIQGIGFQSRGLSLTDLENVLRMFLSFQKTHHNRTILYMEETQEYGYWLLDRIRCLVEVETEGEFGLMILMSGRPDVDEALNQSLLDALCTNAEQRITLAPITSFVMQHSVTEMELLKTNGATSQGERLIVRMNERSVQEFPLNRGHILIGRDKLCDVQLDCPSVSRHHALVVNSSDGVTIVDLGSTNGTLVDGEPVKQLTLQNSGVVAIGDCSIEYVAGGDRRGWYFDIDHPGSFEPYNANSVTQSLEYNVRGKIKGNINSKG